MQIIGDERRLHLCENGWEAPLLAELGRAFPQSRHAVLRPGWLSSDLPPDEAADIPSLAFASQCLPCAVPAAAPSVSQWAKSLVDFTIERLRDHEASWRLHVAPHFGDAQPAGVRRCELIRQAACELLRQKQRRLLRTLNEADEAAWQTDETLVQLVLTDPAAGWMSFATADVRCRLRRCLSRFPAGIVDVPQNREAPSRAFRKLAEVELRLGRPIAAGEFCIDLGSSPGSWAWLVLQRRARVTAVDRSPLRDDLMAHPRVEFVRGDAFRYEPERCVDWLLSDVVAFPDRIAQLLNDWLAPDRCRQFCVTVKFRGRQDDELLEPIKRLLAASGREYCVRRLCANRNEVTVYGLSLQAPAPATLC